MHIKRFHLVLFKFKKLLISSKAIIIIIIIVIILRRTLKVSNWKTPAYDRIHGFWFKKFTTIQDRQVLEMNRCPQEAHVPEWMTKRKVTLSQKDLHKETAPNNYRPITCLPMMLKILTAQIREEIYGSLTSYGLFPEENHSILINESKTRQKNLTMALIDYKKAYDMIPQSWIINCLKMYQISDEVINFIKKTMKPGELN